MFPHIPFSLVFRSGYLLLAFLHFSTISTTKASSTVLPARQPSPLVAHQMASTFVGSGGTTRHKPSDLTCPATGFYCLDSFFPVVTPHPGPRSLSTTPAGKETETVDKAMAEASGNDALSGIKTLGGGGGGGGEGGDHQDPRLFFCPLKGRRPRVAATCPQERCVRDYCLGSTGPVRVPAGGVEGGDGVYCGRTLNRAVSKGMGYTTARMTNGGGHPDGGDETSPQEYDGYLDGDEFGYHRDHLYYIRGNQGVDLGPCKHRCIRQAPGTPDYCET